MQLNLLIRVAVLFAVTGAVASAIPVKPIAAEQPIEASGLGTLLLQVHSRSPQ
jgi:hypothetical protein